MINTFGDLVRCKREGREMSLNSVAKEAQLDVAYISKIEKNITKQPSFLSVSKISRVLNITSGELAQVFDVPEIEGGRFEIEDSNIERKMVLSQMNNTIIKNSEYLNEESIETSIQVLTELRKLAVINKKKRKFLIFIIQTGGEELVIESSKYDYNVKNFIEDVYREEVRTVVEANNIQFSNLPIIGIDESISFAEESGYLDKKEIIRFKAYIEK